MKKTFYSIAFFLFASVCYGQNPKYRAFMPYTQNNKVALNNTVSPQLANQNINFNTGNNNIYGSYAGQFNTGGINGTIQYTQVNTPGYRISQIYNLPYGNNIYPYYQRTGFSSLIGSDNPYFQMATQGIGSTMNFNVYQNNYNFMAYPWR